MFLSFSTVVLALSVSFIPFAANIAVLATTSSAAEFAMGMLDTGMAEG